MQKAEHFWTKANRPTFVTRTEISEWDTSLSSFHSLEEFSHPDDLWLKEAVQQRKVVWRLSIFYQTGLDPEQVTVHFHPTKEAAAADQNRYQVGSNFDPTDLLKPSSTEFDPSELSILTKLAVFGRGGPPYELIYEVLHGSGLYDSYQPSKRLIDWVGVEGCAALEKEFGENWSCVAVLEYCVKHFDETALATLAARAMVANFISPNDYDAGYASRELQLMFSGAEQEALNSAQRKKNAGQGGGQASSRRRQTNIENLMTEIERLEGAVGLFSEERIFGQAIESLQSKELGLPKSKATLDDYVSCIKTEEPFRSRYRAIFHKST